MTPKRDRSCMLVGDLSHALADNGSGGGEVAAAQPATEPLAPTPGKASRVYSEGGTNAVLKCAKCKEQ